MSILRRTSVTLALLGILLAACSRTDQLAVPNAQTGQTNDTTAPYVASTPAPDPATTPPPPVDPTGADIAAIKAMYRTQNDAFKRGTLPGLETLAATAYPPGGVTVENIVCPIRKEFEKDTGQTVPPEDVLPAIERAKWEYQIFPIEGSFEPTPDWVLPAENSFGGGRVPEGRIYVVVSDVTIGTAESRQTTKEEMHATVIDGSAYYFPSVC